MPISAAKMARGTASVTFTWEGETATVTYWPGRVTEKTFAQLESFAGMNSNQVLEGFASLNTMIVHLVKDWDVYENEEETILFPLEAVRLAELPIGFRLQLIQAILGDIRPETIAPQIVNSHN